ncbi:MAG TPA: hypothetical protein VFY69_09140 [Solirubrobacterales bacterium]|nr:hypothetical protein [Solirubrobacterales bacterium]
MKRLPDLRPAIDSVLRGVSLVVTDRRWAAPLSAIALGFGLFLGVAIGPGAAGTLATGADSIVAVAAPGSDEPETAATSNESEAPVIEPANEAPLAEPEPVEEPAFVEPGPLEPAPVEPFAEEEAPPAEPPAEEEPEEEGELRRLQGTVVHANPAAGSYAMAIAGGELVSVHAPKLPLPGEKLTTEAAPLPNNTFAEEERERSGTARQASLRGVVTHVDPDPADPTYTLSGRGSSILVHVPPSPAPQLPLLGAYATVGVRIEKPPPEGEAAPEAPPAEPAPPLPCAPDPTLKPPPEPKRIVVQRKLKTEPEPATYVDLAGIVSAACPQTSQLLLSADDLRAGGDDLLLTVPPHIRTSQLKPGASVVATATVEEDGTLTLAGLADDDGRKGAEATTTAQGDLKR